MIYILYNKIFCTLQMALYESILASPHRTLNGDEADFYYVPVLDSCLITRAGDAPHLSMRVLTSNIINYFSLHLNFFAHLSRMLKQHCPT